MNKFEYELSTGEKYVVTAPEGTTQSQADLVFYSQVASGALVGYENGQTLSAATVTPITNELSRQSRGTAGVPGILTGVYTNKKNIVNSIYNAVVGGEFAELPLTPITEDPCKKQPPDSPVRAGSQVPLTPQSGALVQSIYSQTAAPQGFNGYFSPTETEFSASVLAKYPAINAMVNLGQVPVQSPIDQADIILAKGQLLSATAVGTLDAFQIQTIMAQAIKLVDQPSDVISQEKGVGKYGLSCYQLERTGYVKPGISGRYIETNLSDFVSVMNTPSIWTGKNGVVSLDDILSDSTQQDVIFNTLLEQGYAGLQASGVIEKPPEAEVATETSWLYTDAGLQPLGDNTVYTTNEDGTIGVNTFGLVPTTSYSTLESGVTNESSTCSVDGPAYNYNVLRTNVENQLDINLAALLMNSAKFGPELASLWAGTGSQDNMEQVVRSAIDVTNSRNRLLNQLGGAASLYNGSISTTNPLTSLNTVTSDSYASFARTSPTQGYLGTKGGSGISPDVTEQLITPVTQLTSRMNVYGKAAQFAVNFVAPSSANNNILTYASDNQTANNNGNPVALASLSGNYLINSLIADGSLTNVNTASSTNVGLLGDAIEDTSNFKAQTASKTYAQINTARQAASLITGGSLSSLSASSALSLASRFGSLGNLVGGLNRFGNLFGGGNALISGTIPGPGYSDTVKRSTVDTACLKIIGNPKVPQPIYGYPSGSWLDILRTINAARSRISGGSSSTDAFATTASRIFYRG